MSVMDIIVAGVVVGGCLLFFELFVHRRIQPKTNNVSDVPEDVDEETEEEPEEEYEYWHSEEVRKTWKAMIESMGEEVYNEANGDEEIGYTDNPELENRDLMLLAIWKELRELNKK